MEKIEIDGGEYYIITTSEGNNALIKMTEAEFFKKLKNKEIELIDVSVDEF